jgi:rhamnosyltransferase
LKISLIIRTKNEERWITDCLQGVFNQTCKDFEVIIVDNQSTDATIAKAKQFPITKIVSCDEYLPGTALNIGIRASQGAYIVCLSGHCIPVNDVWLEHLYRNMDDPHVAGVYGRQEPLSFTPDADKRDLMLIFGPERRVQVKDSFFHNANSLLRRDLWERFPFDEQTTNIEDRLWAQTVQQHGFTIVYEPDASVYHYHGIHQNGDRRRCQNVVRILEHLGNQRYETNQWRKIHDLNIVALIPIKGDLQYFGVRPLFEYTLQSALKSQYIDTTVVATDNEEIAQGASCLGANLILKRDAALSRDYVGLEKVYKYCLEKLEKQNLYPDVLVLLEITYPFREDELIDNMIATLVLKGFDTVLPARLEHNAIWLEGDEGYRRIDDGLVPRKYKKPVYLSYKGLGCVTRPALVRNEQIFGDNIGMYEIDNPYSCLEIRDDKGFKIPILLSNNVNFQTAENHEFNWNFACDYEPQANRV